MGLFRKKKTEPNEEEAITYRHVADIRESNGTRVTNASASDQQEVKQMYKDGIAAYQQWTKNHSDLASAHKAYGLLDRADKAGFCEKPLPELGYLLVIGVEGIPKDMARAKGLFLKAAETGNRMAMNNLAHIYEIDGEKENAVCWFTRAAEAGYEQSIWTLAKCYWKGLNGLEKNASKAREWARRLGDDFTFTAKDAALYEEMFKDAACEEENEPEEDNLDDMLPPAVRACAENAFAEEEERNYQEAVGWTMMALSYDGLSSDSLSADEKLQLCRILYRWATNTDYPGIEQRELDLAGIICFETLKSLYESKEYDDVEDKATLLFGLMTCYEDGFGVAADKKKADELAAKCLDVEVDDSQSMNWY